MFTWAVRCKEHQLPVSSICFQTRIYTPEGQTQRGPRISPIQAHNRGSSPRVFQVRNRRRSFLPERPVCPGWRPAGAELHEVSDGVPGGYFEDIRNGGIPP